MLNAPIDRDLPDDTDATGGSNVISLPGTEATAEQTERLPRLALAYVLAVFAAGFVSIPLLAPRLDTHDLPGFIMVALLAIALGRTRVPIYGDTSVSTAMVGDFAVAFLYGPAGAAIVSPFAALADFGSGAWYKRLFNVGSLVVVNVLVAILIRGLIDIDGPGLPMNGWLIPIALVAIVVYYLLNVSLLTLAVAMATRTSVVSVFREKFEWLLPHYVIFGMLGLALAVAYDGLGYVGLLAFVAPPLMMRFAIKQYIDKTATNVEELNKRNRELQKANRDILHMADQLRETYDGTLEALVSALDARDRETKGHSLRVAKYMMEIAYHMGIEPGTEDWVNMQRGGLLHDIGKIGVSDTILHKPGPLTDDEWVDMRRHPKIGHDMIRDIGFLSGAAVIVLAHHERFDGKGYPRGLQSDEIPLGARIFVLADTFDAMTSDRPYRKALSADASREEIIKCSGTQFDPKCVQAFLLAWERILEIRWSDHDEETEHHAAAAPRIAA
ncbi:MAG TPA: HD-GYP domain-containing protein [Dehalococcoidia bacterium]|jgi:putative nucleotidyltransferase with HDIG domain